MAMLDIYLDEVQAQLLEFMDGAGLEYFPWSTQVSLKDKIYLANIEFVDYDEEKEMYTVRTIISEENTLTGDVAEHSIDEECYEAEFVEFMTQLCNGLKDAGFYPQTEASDFELDIYDWINDSKNNSNPDDVFACVIKKCKESEQIFNEERLRTEFIARMDKKEEDEE